LNNDFRRDCYEIIVVDNGSTDLTSQVASEFPVKLVKCDKRGIGAARNFGTAKAEYDVVCFVDSDCVVPFDHFRKISSYFDAHPMVDGVGGPVLPYVYDGINDWSLFIEEIYAEACDFPRKEVTIGPREEVWTHTLKGPNMSFRKSALVSVSGFEERMPGEDIEICWRLVENGSVLRFLPDLEVFLHIPGDLRKILNSSFKWGVDCMALRRKYPRNPMTFFSKDPVQRKQGQEEIRVRGPLLPFRVESLRALLSVSSILLSIPSSRPLYGNRKKAFLRGYMLAAFYLGYFHAPERLMHWGELGSFGKLAVKGNTDSS
jgi:cellulose synthase/poly-beta-1,6-N-acetylglucosamine synthase-like glycosyltransferase